MALARSLVVAAVVALSPIQAWAECAWVLWEYESAPTPGDWRILRTYDTRTTCAADHAKLMTPNSAWRLGYEQLSEDSVMQKLRTGLVIVKRALCVPGTIDPRGPRGSGR
jgi:hypothetical protein